MANIKPSNTFTRQLPDHVKSEYPHFVEFLKAYYEYLENNHLLKLEDARSIDRSLDSFVDIFKKEMASRLPIEMANDPRNFLENIYKFYASRGSEESYKFLFRSLYGKEVEIFYPSTQILRVSDGRWKQDISVFLKVDDDSGINPESEIQDLFQFSNKLITITTSKKSFNTYVERVVLYSGSIYEIFIQRDYSDEIEVGSTLSATIDGITYSGTVQKCPTKLSVFKGGTGFKAGDIFLLRTGQGRGCEIKVTKVGSLGEIKSIQVLAFGLDYKTRFFSYLSSKTNSAFEYIHPINYHYNSSETLYDARPASYEEVGIDSYIEAGYATRQTYMKWDTTSNNTNPLYGAGDYVGQIDSEWYTNLPSTLTASDQDELAIIDIQLGAVAKYPGYYETQNGFISDEMYIHDGKYYQAYSYVLKVEEQLDKYVDLVKSILHPAGNKLYAEFNIFTLLDVSYTQPAYFQRIYLSSAVSLLDSIMTTYSNWIYDPNEPTLYRLPLGSAYGEEEPAPVILNDLNIDYDARRHVYQLGVKVLASEVPLPFSSYPADGVWNWLVTKPFGDDIVTSSSYDLSYPLGTPDTRIDARYLKETRDLGFEFNSSTPHTYVTLDTLTYEIIDGYRENSLFDITKPLSSSIGITTTEPIDVFKRDLGFEFNSSTPHTYVTIETENYNILDGVREHDLRHFYKMAGFDPETNEPIDIVYPTTDKYTVIDGDRDWALHDITKPLSSAIDTITTSDPIDVFKRDLGFEFNSSTPHTYVTIDTLTYPVIDGYRENSIVFFEKNLTSIDTTAETERYSIFSGDRDYALHDLTKPLISITSASTTSDPLDVTKPFDSATSVSTTSDPLDVTKPFDSNVLASTNTYDIIDGTRLNTLISYGKNILETIDVPDIKRFDIIKDPIDDLLFLIDNAQKGVELAAFEELLSAHTTNTYSNLELNFGDSTRPENVNLFVENVYAYAKKFFEFLNSNDSSEFKWEHSIDESTLTIEELITVAYQYYLESNNTTIDDAIDALIKLYKNDNVTILEDVNSDIFLHNISDDVINNDVGKIRLNTYDLDGYYFSPSETYQPATAFT